jgi:alpha-L-arabinofuranosidase
MRKTTIVLLFLSFAITAYVQKNKSIVSSKQISPDLFGIFFEDISYAADGGLYGELVQNRSFEYTPSDVDNWNPRRNNWSAFTAWEYTNPGYAYGKMEIESGAPLNPNNSHYIVLTIEDVGSGGVGLINYGFDGIAIKAGERYNFSVFVKQLSAEGIPLNVSLQSKKGEVYGEATFSTDSKDWKKYFATITANKNADSAKLVILAKEKGKLALDMVSLFPEKTFRNRPNGLRADLAQAIADLHPKFMRFPGGCLVHGDGLGNMYRWKNTIGPIEQRTEQRNIWNYHQTVGLGYYEFFLFCEDIGAKPLPIVAAGVSCQNSGGTWRLGSTGQKAIPMDEMQDYIQEVLDLIEWANGPVTSEWGAKRAAAGHPKPFNLQYVGIGNEDKQTDAFRQRFQMIYNAVKARHPEITVVGTVGPSPKGEDYDLGWKFANELSVPIVDEHYYQKPEWFLTNNKRYDNYNRSQSKVYVGEYASWGNALYNALCEAAYMTSLERNGDVVRMASYAPLLANLSHISWNPDLIYFTNTDVAPTVNYYVQQMFSVNSGDEYYFNVVSFPGKIADDTLLAASCVKDSKTGDVIVKIVNAGAGDVEAKIDLSKFGKIQSKAKATVLTGSRDDKNTLQGLNNILPTESEISVSKNFSYNVAAYSVTVIRCSFKK